MKRKFDRKKLIQIIHIIKNEIEMTDEDYRAVLMDFYGSGSSKDLNLEQLQNFYSYLQSRRFKKPKTWRRFKSTEQIGSGRQKDVYFSKINAIAADLKLSHRYPDAIAKQMFGVEKVEWLSEEQTRAVMSAMIRKQKKIKKNERV